MVSRLCYGFIFITIHSMRRVGWVRWRVEGLEHLPPREQGGMIMAMNHIHWIDIPMIGAMLPFSYRLSWLAKQEIFKPGLVGWWFRAMQVIPIARGRRDLAAITAAVEALRAGATLLVFPEGHRSHDGVLQPGRGGAVRMAMQSGAPIIPIAVSGTEHGLIGALKGEPAVIRIGPPYTIEPLPGNVIPSATMECLTNDLMTRIAVLLPEEKRGPYAQIPADQG